MFSPMGNTNPQDLGNGGTVDGDVTITGDLTVSGGGSLSFDEIISGNVGITNTATTVGLTVNQSGAATALFINQDANRNALEIDTEASSYAAIQVTAPTMTNGNIFHV